MSDWARVLKSPAVIVGIIIIGALIIVVQVYRAPLSQGPFKEPIVIDLWQAPDTASIPRTPAGAQIRYGRDLVARTSYYLGPHGTVAAISNGMNCQNCHLDAGTRPYGNNFGSVSSLYPKFRPRMAALESIEHRINDCMQRSLNGNPLDSLSTEMRAMTAYIHWLGQGVKKGEVATGSGLVEMDWMDRAASSLKGQNLYLQKCQVCHGRDGQGQRITTDGPYIYPPLWGEHSFNTGAGMYRISNFARYTRANMPFGNASYSKPVLTEEESWDIAAYVLSLPRPERPFKNDWPNVLLKPVDHPFGPYPDSFSERQHKYGPFLPILASMQH